MPAIRHEGDVRSPSVLFLTAIARANEGEPESSAFMRDGWLRAALAHALLARAGFQSRPISAKRRIGDSPHPGAIRGAKG